jgi:hypothetical protein
MRRHRLLWLLKWGGTVTCGLILLALMLSATANFRYDPPGPIRPKDWTISPVLGHGAIAVMIEERVGAARPAKSAKLDGGFRFSTEEDGAPWVWWAPFSQGEVTFPDNIFQSTSTPGIKVRYVMIPLWQPLVLFLILTAYLWYKDRRFPPGQCQACGYDLTGNESGRCPECGTEVQHKAPPSSQPSHS